MQCEAAGEGCQWKGRHEELEGHATGCVQLIVHRALATERARHEAEHAVLEQRLTEYEQRIATLEQQGGDNGNGGNGRDNIAALVQRHANDNGDHAANRLQEAWDPDPDTLRCITTL